MIYNVKTAVAKSAPSKVTKLQKKKAKGWVNQFLRSHMNKENVEPNTASTAVKKVTFFLLHFSPILPFFPFPSLTHT